jgi:cytoskeletal protein RodZ
VAGVSVEIGSYLRQAREAIGLSLDQLQEKTKIQKSFLIAIENGEFDKLPSPFYVRTYLRSYANCVKVEPHHILRHYRKIEQAERFTGVHKAVSEKDLSQTQTFQFPPLQQTGKIPVVSPGTGPQSVVSQETLLRKPLNQKPAQRIDTKTALTAPKTETSGLNDSARRNRELARRDVGYMRSNTSIMRAVTPNQQQQQDTKPNQTVAASAQKTNNEQMNKEKLFPTAVSKRTRELPIQSNIPKRGTTGPQAAGRAVSGPLSRLSKTKTGLTPVSLPPVPAKEISASMEGAPEQKATQLQRLSRSAVKNRKSAKKSSFKWPIKRSVAIAIAGLVLCIPVAWAVVSYVDKGNEAPDQPHPKSQESPNPGSQQPVPAAPVEQNNPQGKLILVEQGNNVNNYRWSGSDKVNIVIKAVSGKCLIQLTDNLPGTTGSVNKFADVTIKQGESWPYTYNFSHGPDLYIGLKPSDSVVVTVNGKVVNSSRYVHIKYVQ